ncbi:hypothetical protein ACSFA8_03930 [Variovorax sp. RT4R15]|uniref:hypothetical protein n=1 Tax=Variovorax sp. RT4R15 TaxID=3443737 RepID=UPI003F474E66
MKTLSDRALLERALIAIEQVMARTGSAPDHGVGTPAGEAVAMCLTSAAALVDVAQVLLRQAPEQSPEIQSQQWQALIGHTKNASRTAHQAVLVLSSQRNLVAAQDGITLASHPGRSAGQAAH